jgi:hypothetical protein
MTPEQLHDQITALENRQNRVLAIGALVIIVLFAALLFQWRQIRLCQNPQKLRVRELTVVDERGTDRVIIGSPLPHPTFMGKRQSRGSQKVGISGILIADATGTERGGYVTDDGYGNAFLTLDGQGHQTVLLLAEPNGSTMFRIWNGDKGSVTMGVEDDTFLNLKQNGKAVFLAPANNLESRDPRF